MTCPAGYTRTQFCGATLSSFHISGGWNGQAGGCDIVVVQDDCNGGGLSYADYGNGPSSIATSDFFSPPPLGFPCTLRFGALQFGGLLQSWKENDSASGAKTYSLRLIDPQDIVNGTQIILNSYIGNTFNVPNLVNVFGWLEHNLGAHCTEMTTFGTYPPFGFNILLRYDPASGFGGADIGGGLSWWQIKFALTYLLNQDEDSFGGKIDYRDHAYNVDLSEIPYSTHDIRFSEESMSLGELIAEVCELSSCDYFYELVNHNTIKVRVVDKKEQENDMSALNVDTAIEAPIDDRLNLGTIGGAISGVSGIESKSRGLELRNAYTNAFLTGEYRQDIWQINWNTTTNPLLANIWPYWGMDINNTTIPSYGIATNNFSSEHYFDVQMGGWGIPGLSGMYRITTTELRFALAGETQWRDYVITRQPSLVRTLHWVCENTLPNVGTFAYVSMMGGVMLPRDTLAVSSADALASTDENMAWQRMERVYRIILQYAQTYFGRKFLVKLPYLCIKAADDAPYTIETNWNPARDGGWYAGSILGLMPGSAYLEHFRQDDGKIIGFVGFESSRPLDMSAINNRDDYIQINPFTAYVKCQVEDIVMVFPGDWRAIISLPGPVYNFSPDPGVEIIMGLWAMAVQKYGAENLDKEEFAKIAEKIGSDKVKYAIAPLPLIPIKVAIPLQSTRLTYGPWGATVGSLEDEVSNNAGRTNYQRNTEFAPWNFNGMSRLNDAADAWVYGQLSNHYVTEQGNISVPEPPSVSVGEALYSNGPLVTDVVVSVQGGNSPILTTYTMKTYTPDYGKLMDRYIGDLRRIGGRARKVQRMFRLHALNKFKTTFDQVYGLWQFNVRRAIRYTTASSHDILAGENVTDIETDDGYRSNVAITEMRRHLPELHRGYSTKATMDINGLLRPFSTRDMSGSGEVSTLPYFENSDYFNNDYISGSGFSPMYSSGELHDIGGFFTKEQLPPVRNEDHLPIVMETLSPFLNSDLVDSYLLGTSKGHDIEYIARDGIYPTNLSVRHPHDDYSDAHWYRGMALKGPLIIAGWGYDIDNKPVPNMSEDYPDNPRLKFAQDWLRKPNTWKCGPVDLRWDYNRKVWTAPPSMKITKVELKGTLLPIEENEAPAQVIGEQQQYNRKGRAITHPSGSIMVSNNEYTILTSGMRASVYYDTHQEKYYVISPSTPTPFKLISWGVGSGVAADIALGTPNPRTNGIDYDDSNVYKARDFRTGVPEPGKGATGEGICTPSDDEGWYLRIIDMDCTSPGFPSGWRV